MATLHYRDPGTGQWVAIPTAAGSAGTPGPPGPVGVATISTVAGNRAVLGSDGELFVPAGGLDPATAAALYVDVPGDAMTGELRVPDQVSVQPTSPLTAAAKGYVDQVVTASEDEPAGIPVRDGLAWFVIGEPEVPPAPPTIFAGVYTSATDNTLTWVDSADATATYEIRYNVSGAVVGNADPLVATGIASGVQTAIHVKDAAAQASPMITYGIKAVNVFGSSAWVPASVAPPIIGTITLTYPVGATAIFTVSGAFTVDWGDGSAVESHPAGTKVTHASPGVTVVESQPGDDLTSFVLDASDTASPTGIVFDAASLKQITLNKPSLLVQADFLSPVVLDSCANLFVECSALTTVSGSIASSGTDFSYMFSYCASLTTVPLIDTSGGTGFTGMFHYCSVLTDIPLLDTSSGIEFGSMFNDCRSLVVAPMLDTSSGTDFYSMFNGCERLTSVPLYDTGNGTTFNSMFYGCDVLAVVPSLNTGKGTDFSNMFAGCWPMVTAPMLDTSSGTIFDSMFYSCAALVTVPAYDLSSGTSFLSMFLNAKLITTVAAHGARYSISVWQTKMAAAALNTFFTNLGTAAGAQVATITSTPGAATCDRTIATAKGWTVVG